MLKNIRFSPPRSTAKPMNISERSFYVVTVVVVLVVVVNFDYLWKALLKRFKRF